MDGDSHHADATAKPTLMEQEEQAEQEAGAVKAAANGAADAQAAVQVLQVQGVQLSVELEVAHFQREAVKPADCAASSAAALVAEGEKEEAAGHAAPTTAAMAPAPSVPLVPPAADASPADRVFLIETGARKVRAGFVYLDDPTIVEAATSPCVVARPKHATADYERLVRNAGVRADPMYARFRAAGVFVGKNAWYCAFEHPDAALRGQLKLEAPMDRDRLLRPADLTWVWRDVMERMQVRIVSCRVVRVWRCLMVCAWTAEWVHSPARRPFD